MAFLQCMSGATQALINKNYDTICFKNEKIYYNNWYNQ